MRAAVSAMECIGYGSGVAIVITLLCNVPFLSIIHQTQRPVGRIARDELQVTVNNCLLPLVLLYASLESNGLWPGLYTHSLNEAGCLGCTRSRSTRLEPSCAY